MKDKISLIISLIAIIGVLVLATVWVFRSWEVCVLGLDTFIGVTVAILALLFTVVIGYQIINTIDVNRKITNLIQRQNTIETNYQNYTKLAMNLQSGICKSTADLYDTKELYLDAFVFYNWALYYAIEAGQPNQYLGLYQLKSLVPKITNPIYDYSQKLDDILSAAKSIRTTASYRNYFGNEYESILNELWTTLSQLGYDSPQ